MSSSEIKIECTVQIAFVYCFFVYRFRRSKNVLNRFFLFDDYRNARDTIYWRQRREERKKKMITHNFNTNYICLRCVLQLRWKFACSRRLRNSQPRFFFFQYIYSISIHLLCARTSYLISTFRSARFRARRVRDYCYSN